MSHVDDKATASPGLVAASQTHLVCCGVSNSHHHPTSCLVQTGDTRTHRWIYEGNTDATKARNEKKVICRDGCSDGWKDGRKEGWVMSRKMWGQVDKVLFQQYIQPCLSQQRRTARRNIHKLKYCTSSIKASSKKKTSASICNNIMWWSQLEILSKSFVKVCPKVCAIIPNYHISLLPVTAEFSPHRLWPFGKAFAFKSGQMTHNVNPFISTIPPPLKTTFKIYRQVINWRKKLTTWVEKSTLHLHN